MAEDVIVVFDFDWTIIDDDSDRWVVVNTGLTHLFNQLRTTLPWNSLMDRMMEELHSQGKTVEDIMGCLKQVPLHPRIIAAIKSAQALGCELKVLSHANQFFIETILKNHDAFGCFSEIITNPAFLDGDGRLRIFPYNKLVPPHGCNLCPPNLCKGLVIKRMQTSISGHGKKRFIYIADGKGDLCPSLMLQEGDHLMPRKNFPLWEHINNDHMLMKAEIHEWSNGEELERVLLPIIKTISRGEGS